MKSTNHLKKTISLMFAVVLVFLLFVTGTRASKSYSELKKSSLANNDGKTEVIVVDEFDESAGKYWDTKTGGDGTIARTLKIKNVGDNPVFVRTKTKDVLQFKNSQTSTLRYMIDASGDYITLETSETNPTQIAKAMNRIIESYNNEALSQSIGILTKEDVVTGSGHDTLDKSNIRLHRLVGSDGIAKYYIATQKGDIHGQYGKHLNNLPMNQLMVKSDNSMVAEMIEIDSNQKIISEATYNDLSKNQRSSNKYWVEKDDYLYYSVPIFPENSKEGFDSETISLLNSIRLKKEPEHAFTYHIELEVETLELDAFQAAQSWSEKEMPKQLLKSYELQIKDISNENFTTCVEDYD